MKLPRRQISASGSGRCRAASRVALRLGAIVSDQAGADRLRLPAGRRGRYLRSPDRSVAIGAPGPTVHRRKQAGRRRDDRRGNGRESGA